MSIGLDIGKYTNKFFNGCLVMGYTLFAMDGLFNPGSALKGFFQVAWLTKVGLIVIAAGSVHLGLTAPERRTSVSFWIISVCGLAGMFYFGYGFWGFFFLLIYLGMIIYKSSQATGGFLKRSANSYRQLREETEKEQGKSGQTHPAPSEN